MKMRRYRPDVDVGRRQVFDVRTNGRPNAAATEIRGIFVLILFQDVQEGGAHVGIAEPPFGELIQQEAAALASNAVEVSSCKWAARAVFGICWAAAPVTAVP